MNEKTWLDEMCSLAKENLVLFALLYLLLISALDILFKILLGTESTLLLSYFYLNTLSFSILYFVMISILYFFLDNMSIKNSIMRLSSIFWLLAAAPIVTYVAKGTISSLNLMDWSSMKNLLLFRSEINNGFLVIYLIILLIGIMIAVNSEEGKTRSWISGLFGTALSFIAFLVIFSQYNITGIASIDPSSLAYNKHLGSLFFILLFQLSAVILIIMFIWKRDMLKDYISNMKGFRSLHFVTMTVLGFIVLSQLDYHIFEIKYPIDLTFFILPALCMVLTWQFTAMINDIYDIEIDRVVHPERPLVTGRLDRSTYRNTAVVFAVLSLLISLYFGVFLALLNLTFIVAGIMYSKPPIRLKERVYGYICVGYASVVAFFFGVYSPVFWSLAVEHGRWFLIENVLFFSEVFSISLIIFVTLSISPYINALSDYEGDKEAGVKNIYTIYGREKGKKIVTVLIIFLFLSPISLFYSLFDLAVFLPLSLIAAYIYYIYEHHRPIFILYFMVILYSAIRYIELL
ncbi:MAG: UbiA family prenyltransferase [Candidatus Thermoplasmatota archaeon]